MNIAISGVFQLLMISGYRDGAIVDTSVESSFHNLVSANEMEKMEEKDGMIESGSVSNRLSNSLQRATKISGAGLVDGSYEIFSDFPATVTAT